jgi:hypothetical protein
MEFCFAIISIIMCRMFFEYLDIRYRQSILPGDYVKAFYISKDFRVKNKFAAHTYKAFRGLYKLASSVLHLLS